MPTLTTFPAAILILIFSREGIYNTVKITKFFFLFILAAKVHEGTRRK